jgi:hypothetical protein
MDLMDADLMWGVNSSLSIGPWAVRISADADRATLHDLGTLEDLREIHNWDPIFTLRFTDDTTHDVVVGRPDDDGTFTITDAGTAVALEQETGGEKAGPGGFLPEPAPVAEATNWLHEHGFGSREHATAGKLCGSRLFDRHDGWRVRYSCVYGTWSLELSPPGRDGFNNLRHFFPHQEPAWRDALPALIGD